MLVLAILVSCIVAAVGEGNWVLLVAGSHTYYNYRHQADICHAYHIVQSHGIPVERIIVMMYDDIANHQRNSKPGVIINSPEGPNVYEGVPIDYTGQDVNKEVFLKVLTGDRKGIKKLLGRDEKVVESGHDDRVFVYFANHGLPGNFNFPNDELYADDLNNAILRMHKKKKYKQMVLYVEACYSGSMFENILRADINVFVTTAASPDERSYACYYDHELDSYLGDVYSVNWMEDSEKVDLSSETLQDQYNIVKEGTNTSHVMQYGNLTMGGLKLGDFLGNLPAKTTKLPRKYNPNDDAVPSEDVPMYLLNKTLNITPGDEVIKRAALQAMLQMKQATEEFFKTIVGEVTSLRLYNTFLKAPIRFSDFKCYKTSLRLIKELCPGIRLKKNEYVPRNAQVLANICEAHIRKEKIWASIKRVCYESPICSKDTGPDLDLIKP